jgi:hypothetical protein
MIHSKKIVKIISNLETSLSKWAGSDSEHRINIKIWPREIQNQNSFEYGRL